MGSELFTSSRNEPGNVSYDLHRLRNNLAAFYLLANWVDQAALDQHLASEHVRALLNEKASPDLVAPPTAQPGLRGRSCLAGDTDPCPDTPASHAACGA